MASPSPSTASEVAEPEPEIVDVYGAQPRVENICTSGATLSWDPLEKELPHGHEASYSLELQQFDGPGSNPNQSNWLCVYKGSDTSYKADDLRAGRRYAVRLVVVVERAPDRPVAPGVEVRVHNAEHVCFSTLESVPSAMQSPALAQRARNALKLKWNAPVDPGGAFDLTYVLQITPGPLGHEEQRAGAAPTGFVEVYRGPERHFKITRLQPGVRYTSRVQAINPLGEGPFSLCSSYSTQATVPAAPEPPVVQTASSSSLTLVWQPPADNGSPIIGYCLERDDGAGGDFTHVYAGPNTSHTVKGLRPGTQYRFRLRADNDEGKSMWSSTAVLSTGAAPPDSPSSLQVVSVNRTSATLAWRAPDDDGGSRVVAFEVELQAKSRAATACMGADWLKIFEGEAHACTINSLRPGCAYRVRVRACNGAGWSSWALPVDLTTAADIPEVPQTLSPASCTPRTIVITWAPPRHDGGIKVHLYRMEMANADCMCGRCPQALAAAAAAAGQPAPPPPRPTTPTAPHPMLPHGPHGGMPYPMQPSPPPLSPAAGPHAGLLAHGRPVLCPAVTPLAVYQGETVGAEVQNLQPGCRYIFRVQALNSQGVSAWTDWVLGATAPDKPVQPGPPGVAGVAATALMFSWQAPPCQGAPVTHYTLESAPLPAVPGAMLGPPGPAGIIADPRVISSLPFKLEYRGPHTACEVRGLEPYSAYAFRLAAHNEVGQSDWSVAAAAVTSHAPPTCPQLVSAQPTSSSNIVVVWTAPEREYGAPVHAYTVDMAPAARSGGAGGGGGGKGAGGGAVSWTHLYTGPTCMCAAEGLAPGRAYQFRVRAANMCGSGPYAAAVTATTLPAPPSAPGRPVVSGRTSSGFRVRWDEPEHSFGAHVTAFVLELAPAGTDAWTVAYSGSEAAAKLSGLQPATKYSLRVAAVNAAGQGPFSECEAATTMLLPPLPPTELSASEATEAAASAEMAAAAADASAAVSDASSPAAAASSTASGAVVTVSWREPEASEQHAGILGYEVVATPKPGSDAASGPGGGVVKLNVAGRRCEARLEGLAHGCLYGVRVRAVGVDGTGHSSWSEEVGAATAPRLDAESLSAGGSAAAAGTGAPGTGSGGSSLQRRGSAAAKKAAKRQQAAASAAPSAAAATGPGLTSGAASSSGDDAPAATAGTATAAPLVGGRAGRGGKAGAPASRVAAALNTASAKKVRKATNLENAVDRAGLEWLAKAVFGPNWRRDHMKMLWTWGKWLLGAVIAMVVVALIWAHLVTAKQQ